MTTTRRFLLMMGGILLAAGCSTTTAQSPPTSTAHSPGHCVPAAGGRCGGPEPVRGSIIGSLTLSGDGNRLGGVFSCGGQLTTTETPTTVAVTYLASAVPEGGMSCAKVELGVTLTAPLGSRRLIDAVTGQPLPATAAKCVPAAGGRCETQG